MTIIDIAQTAYAVVTSIGGCKMKAIKSLINVYCLRSCSREIRRPLALMNPLSKTFGSLIKR